MNNSSKLLAWFDRVIAASGLIASFIFKNSDGSINKDYLILFASIALIFFLSSLYETGSEIEKKSIRGVVYILVIPASIIGILYYVLNPNTISEQNNFGIFAVLFPLGYWIIIGSMYFINTEQL